jgi:HlyD family secretion protein
VNFDEERKHREQQRQARLKVFVGQQGRLTNNAASFIISQMINNILGKSLVALGLSVASAQSGCQARPLPSSGYQGVVEYEARVLAFEVPGKLKELGLARGDLVKAGATMARLDDELAQLAVQASMNDAQAAASQTKVVKQGARPQDIAAMTNQVAAAKALENQIATNLDRNTRLFKEGARPANTVDDLKSELERAHQTRLALEQQLASLRSGARAPEIESAQARAEAAVAGTQLAKAKLARYTLVADSDGYVLESPAKVGEVVGAGTPIYTVADTTHPYADVFVPQAEIGGLQEGLAAQLRVDTQTTPFNARIEQIGQQTEFTPRFVFSERERPNLMYRVRVRVEDPNRQLRAGLPAFVTVKQ